MSEYRPFSNATAAHRRDPRRGVPAADPGAVQPDQIAAANVLEGRMIPLKQATDELYNANILPQLRQAPFVGRVTVAGVPVLLIPSNTRRMAFLIANVTSNYFLFFSYGFPVGDDGAGFPLGIPINPLTAWQEANGTVSVDEIWVWPGHPLPLVSGLPFSLLGYEGTLALEGRYSGTTGA
jgi:hypothetical protein